MKKALALFLLLALSPAGLFALTADEYYKAGLADYQSGNWKTSIANLKGSVEQDAKYWQAYQLLSYAYFRLDDLPNSLACADASLKINPVNPTLRGFADKVRLKSQAGRMPAPPIPEEHPVSVADEHEIGQAVTALQKAPTPSGDANRQVSAYVPKGSFYCDLSASAPYAPNGFKDGWTTGLSLGLGYGFEINRMTSIVLSGQYSTFPLDLTYPGIGISGGGVHTMMFLANGKFLLAGQGNPVDIYLIGGLGLADLVFDDITLTNSASGQTLLTIPVSMTEMDFALRLGIGIDVSISKMMALYIETNGVDTYVSQKVATEGVMTNSMFSVGMKFDN